MGLLNRIKEKHSEQGVNMSISEYMEKCKTDSGLYLTVAERMLKTIGEPIFLDTKNDQRLSRVFSNRVIKTYTVFKIHFC